MIGAIGKPISGSRFYTVGTAVVKVIRRTDTDGVSSLTLSAQFLWPIDGILFTRHSLIVGDQKGNLLGFAQLKESTTNDNEVYVTVGSLPGRRNWLFRQPRLCLKFDDKFELYFLK